MFLESLKNDYPIAAKLWNTAPWKNSVPPISKHFLRKSIPKPIASTAPSTNLSPRRDGSSSQDPNLQNIPVRTELGRKIREAFRPQLQHWSYLAADYSQIELRLLAHLSEDPDLDQRLSEHNEDIHAFTASQILMSLLTR